jgi:phage/conjugal plasmid C-4 type zinc finger TraR family protein
MTISTQPEFNNEEEAEVAQILDITRNLAAVARVQAEMAEQRARPSLEECEDCGEDIPLERRQLLGGVTRCVHCQSLYERKRAGY